MTVIKPRGLVNQPHQRHGAADVRLAERDLGHAPSGAAAREGI